MTADLISLTIIMLVAVISPIIARIIPGGVVPQTVLLLAAGAVLGPYMAGVIAVSHSVELISELGLAFLFLLAGYEIDPQQITGHQGKVGLATWVVTLGIAAAAVTFFPFFGEHGLQSIAVIIALTTTALGTLLPILKERQLDNTPVGKAVIAFGTWGELGPVLAMALLLSSRAGWQTFLVLTAFTLICIIAAALPIKAKRAGSAAYHFLTAHANTSSQTLMRLTILLLIGLITLSTLFDLDIVLGAFAAGFILRYVSEDGVHTLEMKLEGTSYGFFIPVFFVISGANINISAVAAQPSLLIAFIIALLLIRTIPVVVALTLDRANNPLSPYHRITVALYCTTALPIIVAVTSVATHSGTMSQATASTLVAAGAVTVFVMPLLGSITYRIAELHPIEAVRELRKLRPAHAHPEHISSPIGRSISSADAAVSADMETQLIPVQAQQQISEQPLSEAHNSAQHNSTHHRATQHNVSQPSTQSGQLGQSEQRADQTAQHKSLHQQPLLEPHDWHEILRAHWAIHQHITHGTPLPEDISERMTYTQKLLIEAAHERRQRLIELGLNPDELGARLPKHYKYPWQ